MIPITDIAAIRPQSIRMRTVLFCAIVALFLAAPFPVVADDHRTATALVAIGAELEIIERPLDLVVFAGPGPFTTITLEPEAERPGATRSASADAIALGDLEGIRLQSMYARARADASSSNDHAEVSATALAQLNLINTLDRRIILRVLVHVPGRFPSGGTAIPNDYFARGSADENLQEYAGAYQVVSVVYPRDEEPGSVTRRSLAAYYENRESLNPESAGPGPGGFEIFGVPFTREYRVPVEPSIIDLPDRRDLRLETLALSVRAYVDTVSAFDGTLKPVVFEGVRPLCERLPPASVSEILPHLDPLCRAGQAGASRSPLCSCARDLGSRSQRCVFTFSDFHVAQRLPAPALPGEQVQVDWDIDAFADGDYWFRPEILVNGKWVSVDAKEKLAGKLTSGKQARARLAFTMPSEPTVLRTHMFHLPKGAKNPIESQIDTVIALAKPKS